MRHGAVEVGDRLHALMALSRAVSSSLDVDEVLRAVIQAATDITGSSVISLWAADEAASTLTLAATSDDRLFADFPSRTLRFGQGVLGEVAQRRESIGVADMSDSRIAFSEWCQRHDLQSLYGTPILFEDSLLGVLSWCGRGPLPEEDEVREMLAYFVDQAAIALRNAKLFADSRRRERETMASYELAR